MTTRPERILFVGEAMGVFSDIGVAGQLDMKRCDNMIDAINAAAHDKFDKIVVVMSCFGSKLETGLKALRQMSQGTETFLVAAMYEEPFAIDLLGSGKKTLADEYLISPIETKEITNTNSEPAAAHADELFGKSIEHLNSRIRELEKMVAQDDLTGLKNRRYVRQFLSQIINRTHHETPSATLLMFDIDDFKHYNDTYGHAVGDNVLKQAALIMKKCCRNHDVIGRIGGDEFAVIFWDIPSGSGTAERERRQNVEHPREAFVIAERFRKEISTTEHNFLGMAGKGTLTISGGLASFPQDGTTVEEIFEQADKAMLDAKRSGKNRVYIVGKPNGNGATAPQ